MHSLVCNSIRLRTADTWRSCQPSARAQPFSAKQSHSKTAEQNTAICGNRISLLTKATRFLNFARRSRRSDVAVSCNSSNQQRAYRARWSLTSKIGYAEQILQVLEKWALELQEVQGVTHCQVLKGAFGTNSIEIELDFEDLCVDMLPLPEPPAVFVAQLSGMLEQNPPTWQLFISHDNKILNVPYEQSARRLPTSDTTERRLPQSNEAEAASNFPMRQQAALDISIPSPEEAERVLQESLQSSKDMAPGRKRNNLSGPLTITLGVNTDDNEEGASSAEAIESPTKEALPSNLAEPKIEVQEQPIESEPMQENAELADDDPYAELRKTLKPGQRIATDWKGDPMIINPGDNMCGMF